MAKKRFKKTALAEIPEKPLVYGGNDMNNEKYNKTVQSNGKRRKK